MNFDYNELLREKIYDLQNELALSDFSFEVDSEQAFLKKKDFKPNTVYVLTRCLENDNSIGVDTQPIQVLILSEQNSLDICKAFFDELAKKYNFEAISKYIVENNVGHYIWVKQQYSDPVVLSNFNNLSYGYRSVLYMSVNLYIMYDIADLGIKESGVYKPGLITIDGANYKPLTFDMSYSMTPNTQQTMGSAEYISKSVKSVSSLSINITLPMVESQLLNKILSILNETDSQLSTETTYGGNEDFTFTFYLGTGNQFTNKKLKLVTCQIGTAINNIPSIRLGFVK